MRTKKGAMGVALGLALMFFAGAVFSFVFLESFFIPNNYISKQSCDSKLVGSLASPTRIIVKEANENKLGSLKDTLEKAKKDLDFCQKSNQFYSQFNERLLADVQICEQFGAPIGRAHN